IASPMRATTHAIRAPSQVIARSAAMNQRRWASSQRPAARRASFMTRHANTTTVAMRPAPATAEKSGARASEIVRPTASRSPGAPAPKVNAAAAKAETSSPAIAETAARHAMVVSAVRTCISLLLRWRETFAPADLVEKRLTPRVDDRSLDLKELRLDAVAGDLQPAGAATDASIDLFLDTRQGRNVRRRSKLSDPVDRLGHALLHPGGFDLGQELRPLRHLPLERELVLLDGPARRGGAASSALMQLAQIAQRRLRGCELCREQLCRALIT